MQVEYNVTSNNLYSNIIHAGYAGEVGASFVVEEVTVFGIQEQVSTVLVNNQKHQFTFDEQNAALVIGVINLPVNKGWTITWL